MKKEKDNVYYKIGQLAKITGHTIVTIRYYERLGLLGFIQRTGGGFRVYPSTLLSRLYFIKNAKSVGFSLSEIRALLQLKEEGATSREVKDQVKKKIQAIEEKITLLVEMRDTLSDWERACDGKKPIENCPILNKLFQRLETQ